MQIFIDDGSVDAKVYNLDWTKATDWVFLINTEISIFIRVSRVMKLQMLIVYNFIIKHAYY